MSWCGEGGEGFGEDGFEGVRGGGPVGAGFVGVGGGGEGEVVEPLADGGEFWAGGPGGAEFGFEVEAGEEAEGGVAAGGEVGFGGVGWRDFDHRLWLVNFPAFADESFNDALVGFCAGLVKVAEVSFHVLVTGYFKGKGGGVI